MRVALYPRVSTVEQAKEGYSINEQIDRLKKYCEAMGWDVYKIYTDAGYSGGSLERPGLQEMLSDIKEGKIDKVVVYKLDRLSRSQLDTLYLIEKVFLANGTDFVSMSENFDTSTPFGRAMIGILAVFAQLEREQIRERMSIGKEGRAKEGLWNGGSTVPTGYDYIDGQLIINEFEAMQIREARELILKGVGLRTISNLFNKKGYVRKNSDWNPKHFKYIFQNRLYIGEMRYNNEYFPGKHKAIFTEQEFLEAKEEMDKRAVEFEKHKKRCAHITTLLGNMIYCKNCGARMAKQKGGSKRFPIDYYVCYSRNKKVPKMVKDPSCDCEYVRVEHLDKIILDEIRKLALEPDYVKTLSDTSNADGVKTKIVILREEIEKINAQVSKFMDLYALDKIDLTTISDKIDALTDRKKELEKELETLNADNKKMTHAEAVEIAKTFDEIMEEADLDGKRALVSSLIYYVEYYNKEVIIHWKFN